MRNLRPIIAILLIVTACAGAPEPVPEPEPVQEPVRRQAAPPPEPPPPAKNPLGVFIRQELQEDQLYDLQYYISSNISLTREVNISETQVDYRGALIINKGRDAEEITIAAETPGELTTIEMINLNGVETEYLGICFDNDILNTLYFIPNEENDRYELLTYISNEKKTVVYDDKEFSVLYNAETPYLLIINETKNEDQIDRKTAPGRRLY
jgi:hypothetical protein